ncbi:MAG TPA: DinB family protein [Phycisphaerales bacterium]|nr:DinB family protein [Phycisphaerales bacterium]
MNSADQLKRIIGGQFEAALCMLNDCIEKCPESHWDSPIAKYPFWHVVYHTLCFVDVYLAPNDESWMPSTGEGGFHPAGRDELNEEYPSRRFTRDEMRSYMRACRSLLLEAMNAETEASLVGPSGFPHLAITRAELHLYSIRHVQHHTGQLGASLRRLGVQLRWVKTGWKD